MKILILFLIGILFMLININATTISSCQTISTSGFYDLNQNINSTSSTCITINVSNTELDCRGYSINYSGGGNYGILLNSGTSINNITVRNCVVYDAASASEVLAIVNTNNSFFYNNTLISYQSADVIGMWNMQRNVFDNNRITQKNDCFDGIYIVGASNDNNFTNNIINVTTTGACGNTGIHLDGGDRNLIQGNTIYVLNNSNSIALRLQGGSKNNTFYQNYAYSELGWGMRIQFATCTGNLIYGNFFNSTLGVESNVANNYWNYSSHGNYYALVSGNGFSQTTCSDSNLDGICDNFYTIPGTAGSIDNFPLSSYPYVVSGQQELDSSSITSVLPSFGIVSVLLGLTTILGYFILS